LNNYQQVLVGSLDIVGIGSLEGVGGKHGTETSSTGWWVFGVADDLLCVFLFSSVLVFKKVRETYDSMTHWGHYAMGTLVKRSLDEPFLSDWDSDNWADPRRRNSVVELAGSAPYHIHRMR
jgi:hypothetical protein